MPVQGRCIGDLVGMEALLQWKKRSISIVGRANPFFGRSCRDLYFFVGWRWDAPQTNVECHERNEIKLRTGINHYISWHQEIIFALVIQIFCLCLSFFLSFFRYFLLGLSNQHGIDPPSHPAAVPKPSLSFTGSSGTRNIGTLRARSGLLTLPSLENLASLSPTESSLWTLGIDGVEVGV